MTNNIQKANKEIVQAAAVAARRATRTGTPTSLSAGCDYVDGGHGLPAPEPTDLTPNVYLNAQRRRARSAR